MSSVKRLQAEIADIERFTELIKDVFDNLANIEHRPLKVRLYALDSAANCLSIKHWPDENYPTGNIWHLRGLVCHLLHLHFTGARTYSKDEPVVMQSLEHILSHLILERRTTAAVLKKELAKRK